jgi:hypothetical protein
VNAAAPAADPARVYHPTLINAPLRTRADLQQLVQTLVAPVLPHFSPGKAAVRLGAQHAWYGEPSELLEGFSRPLWGLIPLGAGGGAFAHWDDWREGLASGTDPEHPEFWGWPGDFDQRMVEMAALGLGLMLLPEELWRPLSPTTQAHLAVWLGRVNTVRPVDSNWRFFRVLVNLALRRRGLPWSAENLATDLQRLDEFHLGEGWYSDGRTGPSLRDGRIGDYYGPMGMHFYGLIYAQLEAETNSARAATYLERARSFAQDFIYWFAPDGPALPFGRSLTYRCAQGAFWGALAFAGVEALPWGVIKGVYLRHLRWWMRQPIFTETGLLTIGYTYPNLLMAETYNGPGSPYWALKIFLPLALPDSHPFWQAEEAPLPARKLIHSVPRAGLVVVAESKTGAVTALNPGQAVEDWPRHAPHKYSKFAYSTRFGFSVPAGAPSVAEGGFDSMLALSDDDRRYRGRDHCFEPEVRDGVAYSRWLPWPDVEVRTWLIAGDSGHVRVHRINSRRRLWSAECGFATGFDRRTTLLLRSGVGQIEIQTPMGSSAVRDLTGGRTPESVELGVNSHLLFSLAAMPVLRAEHEPGEFWLACVATGGAPRDKSSGTGVAPDAAYVVRIEREICTIQCDGLPWWETSGPGCGRSEPARLHLLQTNTTWSKDMR